MTDLFETSSPEEDMSVFDKEPSVESAVGHLPSEKNLAAQGAIIEGGDVADAGGDVADGSAAARVRPHPRGGPSEGTVRRRAVCRPL